jgi:hypothetical protein
MMIVNGMDSAYHRTADGQGSASRYAKLNEQGSGVIYEYCPFIKEYKK